MTREEPKSLLTDIRDFTTLFYAMLRRKSPECLEYVVCAVTQLGQCYLQYLAFRIFASFKHCF